MFIKSLHPKVNLVVGCFFRSKSGKLTKIHSSKRLNLELENSFDSRKLLRNTGVNIWGVRNFYKIITTTKQQTDSC